MATLTQSLVKLIADKPISDADLRVARLFLLDAGANIVAGQNSVPGQKLLAWAREIAPDGDLTKLDAGRKALLLGGLCHILEVDDLHRASVVHPGCVVAPAVFALAGDERSGVDALTAFLHGVEATTRVGMAVGPEHYKVWHNTATCGPFGSAVAAASLLNLNFDQYIHALGNAGSQAAGFWQFLDSGAATKHLHAGRGAEAGVVAAQLASHGFTGASDILEGSRGFFAATCTNPPIENLLADPDAPWQMRLTSIKPWPSCRHTHPAIEAALRLHKSGVDIGNASQIIVETYQAALNLCDRPHPQSVYQAKFSLQHCVAQALLTGKVDLSTFDNSARQHTALQAAKIKLHLEEKYETAYPQNWGTAIDVKFPDGTSAKEQTDNAKGDPESPLDEAELTAKAYGLLAHANLQDSEAVFEQLKAMENDRPVPDILELIV